MALTDDPPANKRQAVLQAALALIDARGFHGTSMAAIAERADVGAGTIYRYFEGKEDLINQLYAEARAEAHRSVLSMGFEPDASVQDRLYALWRAIILNYIECPTLYRFIVQYESSPFLRESTRAQIEDMKAPFRQLHQDGIEQGLLRDLPEPVHGAVFTGALSHLVQRHVAGDIVLDETMINQTFEMIWAAYRA